MGFWRLEEARLVQQRSNASAINAETLDIGYPGVPAGKVWHVLACQYKPDVAETQVISFEKSTSAGIYMALLNPISLALNPALATFIEQGMEYLLLPGEWILVRRGNHTVGSLMTGYIQFVESDLPLYTYEEPQIVKRTQRAISTIRQRIGGGAGARGIGGGVPPIGHGSTGGGGGGAVPV